MRFIKTMQQQRNIPEAIHTVCLKLYYYNNLNRFYQNKIDPEIKILPPIFTVRDTCMQFTARLTQYFTEQTYLLNKIDSEYVL